VLVIWTATKGYVDDIPVENVRKFESQLLRFVENSHPGLLQAIREKKALTDDITKDLEQVLKDFRERWDEETNVSARSAVAAPAAQATVAGVQ
jgi:F-type H+-transporting ATPase subunit alpha